MDQNVLEMNDLHLEIKNGDVPIPILDGVSFSVGCNEIYGLIGETGAGKSMTGWTILGLLVAGGRITRGSISFQSDELVGMSEETYRSLRGGPLSVIVQNPKGSLHPLRTIGSQLASVYRLHNGGSRKAARERALEALRSVGIPDPAARFSAYPHELSGGMAQRVLIAAAMINSPRLLIADEPTTGLDTTVQAQILDLVRERMRLHESSVLLITHDLGVVANYCDRIGVMYAGRIVEEGPAEELLRAPSHPYTRVLVDSLPNRRSEPASDLSASRATARVGGPGCSFAERCSLVQESCALGVSTVHVSQYHKVHCNMVEDSHG